MKTKLLILMTLMTHVIVHAAFLSNPFTTNDGPTTLNLVTNIAKGVSPALTTNGLSAAGALTVPNFQSYADTVGSASIALGNAIAYTDNKFAANPQGWLVPSATNHITLFDTNVVTSITAGTGLSLSLSLDSLGYHYTLQATGTNNASITNLNPTVLAQAGGLTTNNFGTYADTAGAANAATNGYRWSGLYDTNGAAFNATNNYKWSGLYDTNGTALNATNSGQLRFTNIPVIGAIVLSSNMTASFSTNSSGIVTATIGSVSSASGAFQPAATNLYGWAGLNTNQIVIGTNIIAQIIGGTNILLTATTNAGVVSVTINNSGNPNGQPSSVNLTNWSTVPTNSFVYATNLVAKITAGTGVTVTATTNSGSINYTVGQTGGASVIRAGSFTATSGGSGSVTFTSTMGSTPVVALGPTDWGVNVNGKSYVIITAVSATGFSWSNFNDTTGFSKTIYYIATLPQ